MTGAFSEKSTLSHINLERTLAEYEDLKTWRVQKRRGKKRTPPTVTVCIFDRDVAPHDSFSKRNRDKMGRKRKPNYKNHHGTHVAGIIASRKCGVFPDVQLENFRAEALLHQGGGQFIPYPEKEWDVLNASWYISKSRSCGYRAFKYPANDTLIAYAADNYFSPGLRKSRHLVRWADAENMLGYLLIVGNLVVTKNRYQYPSNGAFSSLTNLSSLHNLVFAPGRNVESTASTDKLEKKTGTSMATPHVSGAAALLKRLHMRLPMNMIALAIKKGATHKHIPGLGQGVLHVDRANFVCSLLEDALRKTGSKTILKKERVINSIRDYNLILKNYKKSRYKRTLVQNAKSLFVDGQRPNILLQLEKNYIPPRKRKL